jgi:hypothetical protein
MRRILRKERARGSSVTSSIIPSTRPTEEIQVIDNTYVYF